MINSMANQYQTTVFNILISQHKLLKLSIPGKRLFNTYTFKSQMGIMKGHIFCALYKIPAEKLG